jgi:hypothetical protein
MPGGPRENGAMLESVEIEAQGDHEYVVRLQGDGESVESWFRITPECLPDVGAAPGDEESVVRRTVEFLARHQAVPDFPKVVELEDVIASYDDFVPAMTRHA